MVPLPPQDPLHWGAALAINGLLIALAQRAPLLTPAGWVHAGVLGTLLWGTLGWRGWLAVVAYLAMGSLVTRLGFRRKRSLGLAEARGGRRGPENVWGSALVGTVAGPAGDPGVALHRCPCCWWASPPASPPSSPTPSAARSANAGGATRC